MINKYVLGTPLDIRLNFWKKGNTGGSAKVVDVPCDISGYRRSVFYKTSKGVVNVEDSFCSGSTLTWQYKGTDQRITGIYTIVVILYNSDGSELIHQEFEGFGLIMPKYCNEPQPDRHIVRDAWVELYEFHPVIPEVSAITENWIVDGVDTGKVSRGNGWFAGTELTENNLSIQGTFSEIISRYGNILKKGDIYYNVNTSDVYRCESVTVSAIIQTSLWRKIANIKGKDFKYSDFTPEQIDGFMKPANDAAAIAREAAEKAISAAQQAKDEADKLPGIATNLQNAIDTAAATNSEIKSNESERLKSEQKRENSESARVAAEQARASAEEQRKVNESERDMQEQTRQQQEQTRQQEFQSAEQSRQATFAASESARDTEFQSKESQRDAAMQTISQEAQKLTELQSKIDSKQDTISDLETIREGAAKGATALQSYTEIDPIYMADKPSLATKKELATKQDTITAGNGISIEENKIRVTVITESETQPDTSIWVNPSEDTEDAEMTYNRGQIDTLLGIKQDSISDLEIIREGAALGKTALQKHQDISGLATKEEVAGKQDVISDLASIRSGAAKGATALQSYTETDPVYTADKPSIALKSEIPDISGKADKTAIVTETEGNASYAILPNVLTKLGTLASAVTLSLDISKEESGVTNVYDIVFTTPADAPSITWPEGISWIGGSAPAIAGGKTYEVNIMDNLATYGEF